MDSNKASNLTSIVRSAPPMHPHSISTKIIKKLGVEFCKVTHEALSMGSLMDSKNSNIAIQRPTQSGSNDSGQRRAFEEVDEVSSNFKEDGKNIGKSTKELKPPAYFFMMQCVLLSFAKVYLYGCVIERNFGLLLLAECGH